MGSKQSECPQNKGTDDPSVRVPRATPGLEICQEDSYIEDIPAEKRYHSISLIMKSFELKQSSVLSVLNLQGFLEIVQPYVPRDTALIDGGELVVNPQGLLLQRPSLALRDGCV